MPKLILQPLVENAVVHGLEGKIGHGIVYISIENSANTLFLRVKDNGVGMPEEQVMLLNEEFVHAVQPPAIKNAAESRCAMLTAVFG